MRLIHVVPQVNNEATGPTYSVVRMAQSLAKLGEEVTLMSLVGGQLPDKPPFRHQIFPQAWPGRLWRSPAMFDALRDAMPRTDIVHCHAMWLMPTVYSARAAGDFGVPFLISPRGSLSPVALRRSAFRKRLFWYGVHRRDFLAAGCFHATSYQEYKDIRAFGLTNPVAIIPNGIDLPISSLPERIEVSRGDSSRTLLFLGRLHPIKGLELLLEVWNRIAETAGRGWRLRIVGPDEVGHRSQLERMVKRHAIPRVEFAGPKFGEAKRDEYRSADLYVLPTRTENFALTIAEALACGTPVITTRGAPWAGLEENGCGWWVERTPADLEAALVEALGCSPQKLREMGRRGNLWMASDFDWAQLARKMAEVYRWLIERTTRSVAPPEWVRLD